MHFIAYAIFFILSVVAIVHLYWARGGAWPAPERRLLARTVVGVDTEKMPGAALTIIVAGLIFAAGCLPLVWIGALSFPVGETLARILMWALFAVFALRGLSTYTFYSRLYNVVEPFARLNRVYFSPLCLLLAAGYLALLV